MFKKFFVLSLSLSLLTSCFTVPSGSMGVKVNLYGGEKGGIEVVPAGRYVDDMAHEFHTFPTHLQNIVWTKGKTEGSNVDESITFQTKEGMSVNADIGLSYSVDPAKVGHIFEKHRRGINEITNVYIRNIVRDAFNQEASVMPVTAIYGERKNEFLQNVNQRIKDQIDSDGFILQKVSVIGTMRLPKEVEAALNNKIAITQKAEQRENELREVEAQAKKDLVAAEAQAKKQIVEAEAEAKANKLRQSSITSNMLELKRLEVEAQAIAKWDGALPQITSGGNSNAFIDSSFLKKVQKK